MCYLIGWIITWISVWYQALKEFTLNLYQCAFWENKFRIVWHDLICNWTLFFSFFFLNRQNPAYSTLPPEGVFTNTLGLLVLLFGGLIFWIVTRPQWKRPKEPNSILLQPNRSNPEGVEGSMAINFGNVDKSDSDLNNEAAARKRNITVDEAGQRSTM